MKFRCKHSDFTLPGAEPQYPPNLTLEPQHMELKLNFDLEQRIVEGSNNITVVSNLDGATDLILDAVDFDHIEVKVDGSWTYDGTHIHIRFDKGVPRGDSRQLSISYRVIDPVSGLFFSYPDESYPDRAVFVGADHETERARYWLPSIDHPTVRTTYAMHLRAKSEYTILGIGKLEGETDHGDGTKTVHWKHDFPCPTYIASLAIGKFSRYDDAPVDAGRGEIPIAYFAAEYFDPEDLKLTFGRTGKMIRWLTTKVDHSMAWPKYFQYATNSFGGAMENQSLVSWDDSLVLNQELAREWTELLDSINIHEMAHTFFGDMIVIRNFSDAWLKESWATYVSALWFEDQLGRDAFDYDMYLNAQRYFRETEQYIRPIVTRTVNHTWQLFDSHLYPGGAWRIHMIRKMLGDQVFWKAVQDYVRTYVGMTVETVDFQRKFEEHTGRSLQQFFDQWVLEAYGFPDLKVKFDYDAKQGRGTFSIEQQQAKEEKNHVFVFDLDLAMWNGNSYTVKTVHIMKKKQEFTLPLAEKPHHVRLDPEQKVLFRIELECEDELLTNQLQSPDVVGRIMAAEHLIKSGKRKHMQTIAEFVQKEPFYGVRERIYRALGESNSRFAIPILVEQLGMEQDDRVLADLARYVGKFRDEKILAGLKTFLKRDLPPMAKAATLESIGLQRDESVGDLLLQYTKDEGWRGIARAGAYKGLAKLRRKEDLGVFLNAVRYGNELEDIRREMISALADLGQWLDRKEQAKVNEALVDLLRDRDSRIRLTAAKGLQTMKAKETITELRALKGLHAAQEKVAIEKIIKSIQKSTKEDEEVKSLRKKIENFEEKLAKMDEEIQTLKSQKSD